MKRYYSHLSQKSISSFLKLRLDPTSMRLAFIVLLTTQMTSCSYLTSRQSLFGEDGKDGGKSATVPKSQYDLLMKKYEMVMKQNRDANINGNSAEVPVVEKDLFDQKRPDDIVSELNKLEEKNSVSGLDLAETVDVFSKDAVPEKKGLSSKSVAPALDYDTMNIGKQIAQYRNATMLMNQNKFDAALNEFKILENSKLRQISVRSKFSIGELLFKQGEFDLAMQVYEEILQKDAFSGLVLKTLGRLIACSTKLKLKKKEEQYYSVLHDFFEES